MRIVLLYPPPWKIPEPGQAEVADRRELRDGPPPGYQPGDLDGDFFQTPYGLLSLAAQALRAGHQVKVLNLSAYPWSQVEQLIDKLDAELWGLSCWTANRRGVALCASRIRKAHDSAHIVVGGPHASPLAAPILAHYAAIDTVTVGESEASFLELVARLEAGKPTAGIPGTVFRRDGRIHKAPARKALADLDALVSPHEYFDTHIVMTSRGCPWSCTFCGAESQWGRGYRCNSVDYVLDALERACERAPVKMLAIKDDTFTTKRKRVLALCRGIQQRGLRFSWSCDTRVDLLDEELLEQMRLAGCQRLSLGVESGAPEILAKIDKNITVDDIVNTTALAKRVGLKTRFFMMLGNRGETVETFEQTLAFLERAAPHEVIFSCLSIYPGTKDFYDAQKLGWLDSEVFFKEPFQELKAPFDASEQCTAMMGEWFAKNAGVQTMYREGIAEYRAILARLPEHAPAHLDLAGAYYSAGELDDAILHCERALELDHPLPGLALNYLACIASGRGNIQDMMDCFSAAAARDPQHAVLIRNVQRARAWFGEQGIERGLPLELHASHGFELLERTVQPTLPGPLPDDALSWPAAANTVLAPDQRPDDDGGQEKSLDARKRLALAPDKP